MYQEQETKELTKEELKNWIEVSVSCTNRPTIGKKQLEKELIQGVLKDELFNLLEKDKPVIKQTKILRRFARVEKLFNLQKITLYRNNKMIEQVKSGQIGKNSISEEKKEYRLLELYSWNKRIRETLETL